MPGKRYRYLSFSLGNRHQPLPLVCFRLAVYALYKEPSPMIANLNWANGQRARKEELGLAYSRGACAQRRLSAAARADQRNQPLVSLAHLDWHRRRWDRRPLPHCPRARRRSGGLHRFLTALSHDTLIRKSFPQFPTESSALTLRYAFGISFFAKIAGSLLGRSMHAKPAAATFRENRKPFYGAPLRAGFVCRRKRLFPQAVRTPVLPFLLALLLRRSSCRPKN